MILNYLSRLYTKQFVLFMNLLTGRTQKVRFFVAIKFILKTYIWLVAVPIRSHTSNVALVALGVLKLWAICNWAFCNWGFFFIGRCVALGVFLHWALCFLIVLFLGVLFLGVLYPLRISPCFFLSISCLILSISSLVIL